MKNKYLIMLLSVLLCIAMVFTACDKAPKKDGDETTKQTETTEDTSADTDNGDEAKDYAEIKDVEPKIENFFTFDAIDGKVLGEATKYDGKVVDHKGNYFVTFETSVNEKNRVTETFTVYDMTAEAPILTLNNRYDNSSYNVFDWDLFDMFEGKLDQSFMEEYQYMYYGDYDPDREISFPSNLMTVALYNLGMTYTIEVVTVELKPLALDLEETPNGCYYETNVSYAYYDLTGTRIATAREAAEFDYMLSVSMSTSVKVEIGGTVAYIDAKTGVLLRTANPDTDVCYEGYNTETFKYGFYSGAIQAPGEYGETQYLEVYDKATGERVLRYYLDATADKGFTHILRNGDVLIQYLNRLDEDSTSEYDVIVDGECCDLDSYILNVESGELTEIDCNYIAMALFANNEYNAHLFESMKTEFGLSFTENVVNFALIATINEHKEINGNMMDRGMSYAVINNDGSIMFELKPLIPDQKTEDIDNGLGFYKLASGDFVVETYDGNLAIVGADGNVRFYLNTAGSGSYYVTNNCIVTEKKVYDFDGKLLYDFEEKEYTFVAAFGTKIIVSKQIDVTPEFSDVDEFETEYHILDVKDGFKETVAFDKDAALTIAGSGKDYVIIYNDDTNRYTMYNVNLEHVLTTYNPMVVISVGDGYVVMTEHEGETLYYTVQ